jgi:hypothetical protein
MQAVDRHDQLRAKYSLADRHGFKKYYMKMALGIIDMAIVNAWIHFKLVNEEICNNNNNDARSDFIDKLADQLINTRWQENDGPIDADGDRVFEGLCNDVANNDAINRNENEEEGDDTVNGDHEHNQGSNRMGCIPRSVKDLLVDHRSKKK